ncbi:MAG: DUF1080 domain-containing protein [Leeuwenhoekiella sp.]
MTKRVIILAALTAMTYGCKEKEKTEKEAGDMTSMTATSPENQDSEWKTLFDGETLEGWHAYNGDTLSDQWKVEDGAVVLTPAENRDGSQNLISDDEYTDFILSIDSKISEGGNSGILWAVQEMDKYNEPYYTGPEIQVLDNERHPDAKVNGKLHQAGALYDMVAPGQDVANPAGEWNTTVLKIDHKNNEGSVTLNGTEIVKFPVEGAEWDAMVAKSKFADWVDFGKAKTGHIALQDHGNQVSFKNIKIKEL